jgi:hypothetical protein
MIGNQIVLRYNELSAVAILSKRAISPGCVWPKNGLHI